MTTEIPEKCLSFLKQFIILETTKTIIILQTLALIIYSHFLWLSSLSHLFFPSCPHLFLPSASSGSLMRSVSVRSSQHGYLLAHVTLLAASIISNCKAIWVLIMSTVHSQDDLSSSHMYIAHMQK